MFHAVSDRTLAGGKKTLEDVRGMIRRRVFEKLVDFDNHLDNIQLDWTNPAVNLSLDH